MEFPRQFKRIGSEVAPTSPGLSCCIMTTRSESHHRTLSGSTDTATTPAYTVGGNLRQWIKLVVYGLLLLNWGYYIVDDWQIARHTLNDESDWLDVTAAFAVSIDVFAWFVLLFLFELETYALPDESFTKNRVRLMHGIRIVCYVFLAHTVFAYGSAGLDLRNAEHLPDTTSLCELTGQGISFGHNLEYTDLEPDNCAGLSTESDFYLIEDGEIVTDATGLRIETELVWIDVAEAVIWLLILLNIEIIVRLQDRNITRGHLMTSLKVSKIALYGLLWGAAAYWIYRGHYVYAWDEALWILGFMAIGMNLKEWRREIEAEEPAAQ